MSVHRLFLYTLLLATCHGQSVAWAAPGDAGGSSADASVILVERMSFVKTADLNFGRIIPSNGPGTVILAPDGTRTLTGGIILASGESHPAGFAGYGRPNRIVTIRMGANRRLLKRAGGNETMQIDTFIIGSTPQTQLTAAPLSFRIGSSSGMFAFPLGATLHVNARQAPGVYTGTFDVILVYQ